MAYEYGVNLKLDSQKALKDIDALLSKLREMESLAGKVKLNISTTNDIEKQQQAFLRNIQQMQAADQKLTTQRQLNEQKVAQAQSKTAAQVYTDNQKIAQAEEKTASQKLTNEQKIAQEKARTAQEEQKAFQQSLNSLYKEYEISSKIAHLQKQASSSSGNMFTFAGNALTKVGGFMDTAGQITHHVTNALDGVQQIVSNAVNNVLNIIENIGSRFLSYVGDVASSALDQYKTMETAVIGFNNFFTDADGKDVADSITKLANSMPGVSVEDMLKGVRVLSPYTGGNSERAIGAASGVMKAISYSGLDVSQVGYKALYNVGQLASGNFRGLADIRELIRDMPAIEQLLKESERGKKLLNKDGKLDTDTLRGYIKAEGSDAFLDIFKELGTSSKAAGIYDEYAKTLTGATVQAKDTLVTRLKQAFEDSGLARTITNLFVDANKADGVINRIGEKVNSLLSKVNDFIEENDLINKAKEILATAKGYFVEIGKVIGDVIKDLAKSVGVLDDAGNIDMTGIKDFLKGVADFVKGFVKGYGDSIKNIMKTLKDIAPKLGIKSWEQLGNIIAVIYSPFGKLVIMFGRLLTAVLNLGQGLTKFGGILKNIGLWVAQYSNNPLVNPFSVATSGSMSEVGVVGKMKGVAGGVVSNVKTVLAKAMKSAAIFAIGEAVNQFVGEFVASAGGKSAGQTAKDLGDVVVAGVAVGSQFGVVAGAAAAAAVSLKKVIDASNELTETQEQLSRSQREASLSKAADNYLAVAVATLKDLGIYNEFEDKTEHGYESMLSRANEVARNYTNPEEAVRALMETYATTYGADITDSLLRARSDAWVESENKIMTKIDTENEETRQKLIRVYQEMVKEGFLQGQEEGWETGASVESLLGAIKNKGEGITIESNEYLDQIISGLEEGAISFNDILGKTKESSLVIKYWDEDTEYGSMQEYMAAQGFTFDNGVWKTQAELNVTVKKPVENFGDALSQGAADAYNFVKEGLAHSWIGELLGIPKSVEAAGGYITPVYKANGGTLSRGIDTVPAMLAPGEYVMKRSAVSKFGVGVMDALNRGDLSFASRSIGSRFSNSWNNSRSYASTVNNNQRTISQQFTINNRTRGGSLNSYYSLANRMASSF